MKAIDGFEYRRLQVCDLRHLVDPAGGQPLARRSVAHHPLPVHMIETINKIVRTSRGMLSEIGREPTPEELAEKLHVPLEKVRKVLKIAREPLSLETPVGDEGDSHLGDLIEDTNAILPIDAAIQSNLRETTGVTDATRGAHRTYARWPRHEQRPHAGGSRPTALVDVRANSADRGQSAEEAEARRSKDQSRFNIFKLPKAWSVLIWRKNRSFRRPSRRQRSATRAASTTAAGRRRCAPRRRRPSSVQPERPAACRG